MKRLAMSFAHARFFRRLSVFAPLLVPALLLCNAAFGQFNVGYKLVNDLPVVRNSDTIDMPWAGGMNNPQYSAIDLDTNTESTRDLFAYDRDGKLQKTFVFNNANQRYEWWPEGHKPFPKSLNNEGFYILGDYDGDGKEDIFTVDNGGASLRVLVYRNLGTTPPTFELYKNGLMYKRPGVSKRFISPALDNTPIFDDVDGDGDLDVMFRMSFSGCPSYALFDNQSMDEYGVPDSLEFFVNNNCWGKVRVMGAYDFLSWSCDTNCATGRSENELTNQVLFDYNGDGLKDMLFSFTQRDRLAAVPNVGTNASGELDVTQADMYFPSYDQPVYLANQATPYFIDMDHDGFTDMLVANNHMNASYPDHADTSEAAHFDQYYRNTGTSGSPYFSLQDRGGFSDRMIDEGVYSFPAIGDLNGDGLPDMIVGTVGYAYINIYATSKARLSYYQNVGTSEQPVFELVDDDYLHIGENGFTLAHPTLGDLDNDGDLDLILGNEEGSLLYYRNTGHAGAPDFKLFTSGLNYQSISVFGSAHPFFFDLNQDGLLDLVIGDDLGRVSYFENDGTSTEPDFDGNPTIEELGGIRIDDEYGEWASPYLSRHIDSTQNLYLFVGTARGPVLVYGPISDFTQPIALGDSIVTEARYTAITGADLRGSDRDELIIGQRAGGLYLMERMKDIGVGMQSPSETSSLMVFPNPAGDHVTVSYRTNGPESISLTVHSLHGALLQQHLLAPVNGHLQQKLDLSTLPAGIYIVCLTQNGQSTWVKVIRQ